MQSPWQHPQGVGHVIRTQAPDLPSGPWQDCGIIKYSIGSKVKKVCWSTDGRMSPDRMNGTQEKPWMSLQTVFVAMRAFCTYVVINLTGWTYTNWPKSVQKSAHQVPVLLVLSVHYAALLLSPNITQAGLNTARPSWWQGTRHQSAFFWLRLRSWQPEAESANGTVAWLYSLSCSSQRLRPVSGCVDQLLTRVQLATFSFKQNLGNK